MLWGISNFLMLVRHGMPSFTPILGSYYLNVHRSVIESRITAEGGSVDVIDTLIATIRSELKDSPLPEGIPGIDAILHRDLDDEEPERSNASSVAFGLD